MKSSRRKNELMQRLQVFSELFGVQINNIRYYYKVFGNFIFEMICDNEAITFMSDRGEIAVNNQYVLDDSYHIVGQPDNQDRVLEEMALVCAEKRRINQVRYSVSQCMRMLSSKNYLMRAYATFFFPLCENEKTLNDQIDLLESFFKVEQDGWTRLFFVRQLLRLGQDKYFTYFASAINSPDVRVRKIMIHFIPDIIDCLSVKNYHILQFFLEEREKIEGNILGTEFIWNQIVKKLNYHFASEHKEV
ncbi:MAG: hypothetical protein K6G89_05705 [Clostridia bacterium]|nr:hypothetical protein [Clostridia bacterium]